MNNFRKRAESEFAEIVRNRGKKYFSEKRVSSLHVSESAVSAKVTGKKIYDIHIDWGKKLKGQVYCECNCPHYQQGHFCKHIWAVVLDLEVHLISVAYSEAFKRILLHASPEERPNEEPKEKPRARIHPIHPPKAKHPSLLFFERHGAVLGSNYSQTELKKAYRMLTKKFHPDSGGSHRQFLDLDSHHKALKTQRGWK